MIRKVLLSSVAIAAFAAPVLAADLPARAPAPAPVYAAPVFSWTGFYVGVNGGYAGDKFRYPFGGDIRGRPYAGKATVNSSGFLGGVTAGYNYQFARNWVVGIEADYDWGNVEGKVGLTAAVGPFAAGLKAGSQLDNLGTVRARLGYSFDRALVYATGGWAYGQVKSSLTAGIVGVGGIGLSKTVDANGWTVGAGIEYALTNNFSLKTEYLYVDLGKDNLYTADYGRLGSARLDVDTRAHIVRAGLNYRFDWGSAPVVAKY